MGWRRALALAGCFALLTAGECSIGDLGSILDTPGKIVVTNTGTQPAVVAILADDAKSYPTIAVGASSTVTTNVGGRYEVRVIMTPEQQIEYKAGLLELRRTVEKLIDGTASAPDKVYAFTSLAGIKASLLRFEQGLGAGCSGSIKLDKDNERTVNATIAWVTQSGSGFWEATCGTTGESG